jgi:ABC-type nitrate/sulfonate/bicarbonate transport system substrate-binding protein
MIFSSAFVALCLCACFRSASEIESTDREKPLRMAISPYQDTAFLVNAKKLGLEKKYGIKLELLTLPWEETLPAVASAGETVDVSYANMSEYMTNVGNLNKSDDPVLFIYPLWVFKGSAFITFNPAVPEMNKQTINDPKLVKKFFSFKIGAPKNSSNQMLLFLLAQKAGLKFSELTLVDTPLNDGLLAAENGSLDIAGAGGTQRIEAEKRHGRVVLTMDTFGAGDIDGLVCKESVYRRRRKDIDSLIRIQLDCVNYVLSDIDHHSSTTLAYLREHACTHHTLAEFKRALSFQFFPQSIAEIEKDIIAKDGIYSIERHAAIVNQYLMEIGVTKKPLPVPKLVSVGVQSTTQR